MASSNWPSLSKCPGSAPLGHSLHSRSPSEHFWGTFSTEFPENSKTPDLSSLAHFPRTIKTQNAHNLKPHTIWSLIYHNYLWLNPRHRNHRIFGKRPTGRPLVLQILFSVCTVQPGQTCNYEAIRQCAMPDNFWLRQLTSISHRITAPALPGPSDPLPWLLSLSRCLVGFHPLLWTLSNYIIIAG